MQGGYPAKGPRNIEPRSGLLEDRLLNESYIKELDGP